jgi:ribosomal protein S18 acetylase RimI-like enzyme
MSSKERLVSIIEKQPTERDLKVIEKGLCEHATSLGIEPRNYRTLTILLRNSDKSVVGGLIGATVWGWLHIKEFWIDKRYRFEGQGKSLILLAEEEALSRGCHQAYVDTFDFQAVDFYRKLGYEMFGSLYDFPKGHERYFLKKKLIQG